MWDFFLQEAEYLLEARLGLVICSGLIREDECALCDNIESGDLEGKVALRELATRVALESRQLRYVNGYKSLAIHLPHRDIAINAEVLGLEDSRIVTSQSNAQPLETIDISTTQVCDVELEQRRNFGYGFVGLVAAIVATAGPQTHHGKAAEHGPVHLSMIVRFGRLVVCSDGSCKKISLKIDAVCENSFILLCGHFCYRFAGSPAHQNWTYFISNSAALIGGSPTVTKPDNPNENLNQSDSEYSHWQKLNKKW